MRAVAQPNSLPNTNSVGRFPSSVRRHKEAVRPLRCAIRASLATGSQYKVCILRQCASLGERRKLTPLVTTSQVLYKNATIQTQLGISMHDVTPEASERGGVAS